MRLLANGEARTDGICQLCKTEHRLLSDEDRAKFEAIGMTPDEIEGIAQDLEARYRHLERSSPDYHHVKPSGTKDAIRERVRRHRERHKGEE